MAAPKPRVTRTIKLNPAQLRLREDLFASFKGFNSNAVTRDQEEYALRFIEGHERQAGRYVHIPFCDIMTENKDQQDYLTVMAGAYDILLKYVVNLMKHNRPQSWRSIKTTTAFFQTRVACMKGALNVLKAMGYTNETGNSVEFPPEVAHPDPKRLSMVAAEILMAKLEVEKMKREAESERRYPHQGADRNSYQRQQTQDLYSQPSVDQSGGRPANQHETEQPSEEVPLPSKSPEWTPASVVSPTPQPDPSSLDSHGSSGASTGESPHASMEPQTPSQGGFLDHLKTLKAIQDQRESLNKERSRTETKAVSEPKGSPPDDHFPRYNPTAPIATLKDKMEGRRTTLDDTAIPIQSGRGKKAHPSPPLNAHLPTHSPAALPPLLERETDHLTSRPITGVSLRSTAEMGRSVVDATGIARPPDPGHVKYPVFETDVRMQNFGTFAVSSAESSAPAKVSDVPTHVSPSVWPASLPGYCDRCKCKIAPGDAVCPYCRIPVSVNRPSPQDPPMPRAQLPNFSDSGSVVRAKPMDVQRAEKEHQRTQLQVLKPDNRMASGPGGLFDPVELQSQRPPPATGQIHPHHPSLPTEPTAYQLATGQLSRPPPSHPSPGGAGIASGEASGGATGVSRDNRATYTDTLKEKMDGWSQHTERCIREGREINYSDMPKECGDPEKARKKDEEKRRQFASRGGPGLMGVRDSSRFNKESIVDAGRLKHEDELRRKMGAIVDQGANLLKWIKVCHSYGYSLGETEIAVHRSSGSELNPLDYLQTHWVRTVRNVRQWVGQLNEDKRQSVGYPSEEEARKFLVECRGDVYQAVNKCHDHRVKQVQDLLTKTNRCLPAVTFPIAVQALCANEMDVTTAFCALQAEGLQPLYEHVFGEWQKVKRDDMADIKKQIKGGRTEEEALHRLLMAEYRFETSDRAKMVPDLIRQVEVEDEDYPLHYYIDAVKSYDNMADAMKFLQQPCPICATEYPIQEMLTMPGCADSVCKSCFKQNFEIVIKDKSVKHFNCPVCGKPDLSEGDQSLYLELFVAMVKEHIGEDIYTLCSEKLRDFNLSKEKNFRWCANEKCRSGIINETTNKKIRCLACKEYMCFECQKPWEEQHEGLSCEEFAQWKHDNDPEAQEQGLAAHLKSNGIECPACHMRYSLARGGCMHFKCTQCPNEFCSGCGQSFKNGTACGKLKSCEKKGLHAHHPRDCLFYLRDFDVTELQQFLGKHNVRFDTDPAQGQVEAAKARQKAEKEEPAEGEEGEGEEEEEVQLTCHVVLQKELVDGLVDEECGDDAPDGHAGLCVTHYKEYLVGRINHAKLDPITMYETRKVSVMLVREDQEAPEQEDDETDEDYRERLIKHVQEKMPLER